MTNILDNIEIGEIIGKSIAGNASQSDLIKLENWLKETPKNEAILKFIKDENNLTSVLKSFERVDKDFGWKKLEERLSTVSLRKQILKWKIAAILIFIVGIGGSFIGYLNSDSNKLESIPNTYTTVITENGQTSKIILPDSSIVWLNSGTTLSYNNNFSVSNRNVKLNGEAYFKVTRNEVIPLIVQCDELEVKVLGTEFNVSAFPENDDICVVLERGSIELSHVKNRFQDFELKPGEIARFDDVNNKLVVGHVDTYQYISWKDGVLIFKDTRMKDVFTKLERWYGLEIDVENPEVNNLIFNATIVDENLEDIFQLIKYTCDIDYKITYSHNPLTPIKITINK
ncbi:FecR domain-containing protein [Draconibacterium sp.]|jgi:ferric-dicitrate binding protein FerR (iron transport regulator)